MSNNLMRPGSLARARQRAADGEDSLRNALAEFLDEFYLDTNPASRAARLHERPSDGEPVIDAYFGAIAEHLSARWRLGPAPSWVEEPNRFLSKPFFLGSERDKPFLLADSPSAFRRRFIFTEADPLRRARMPRDLKWWSYEQLRNGTLPTKDDLLEAIALSDVASVDVPEIVAKWPTGERRELLLR